MVDKSRDGSRESVRVNRHTSNPSGADRVLSGSIRVHVGSYRLNGNRLVDVRGSVEDPLWYDAGRITRRSTVDLLAGYLVSLPASAGWLSRSSRCARLASFSLASAGVWGVGQALIDLCA